MGSSSAADYNFTSPVYTARTATYAAAPTATAAFKARELDPYLDPSKFQLRESRNSIANPKSTPVILGLDVTGSMGMIAKEIAAGGMGTIIKEIVARKPVSDPHLMFMGIGDAPALDRAPLQASQFETGEELFLQLDKLWVEGKGGGNNFESYNLPWHFAAYHTSADAFEKDGRMGFLFTFGDETAPPDLTAADLARVYGREQEPLATNRQLLDKLKTMYHVFHLIIAQGSHCRYSGGAERVKATWEPLLGQNVSIVTDYTKLPEVVISIMQVVVGDLTADAVSKTWSAETSLVVANATRGVVAAGSKAAGGLVRIKV